MTNVHRAYAVLLCLLALSLELSPALAQSPLDGDRKRASAVRVPGGAIRVDGRLDDSGWQNVPPLTDFVQRQPDEGAPPTDRMEVRFAYDDVALHVGARMFSTAPIQSPMGRRDEGDQAEHLLVSLDTYLDRRTASTFGVTASGVRLDHYYASDDSDANDSGFNPIWQARTSMDATGWVAELWIPFSQLRFNDRSPQVWGLNVQRWIPSRNEMVFWALVPRTEERWASLFGDLQGIDGIRPSRRLELLPFVSSDARIVGDRDPADPFTSAANPAGRVGVDIKTGFGSNLTLEATVNPDFGQVEADPAEVNLSAFETFFDERRPFFVEGSQLLTGNVDNFFYSRRIGARPSGQASGDFVDFPSTSTILGAAKLTGRLASGMSIGMLGALTAEESAETFTAPNVFGNVRVAPRTSYGVARVQQEMGSPGSIVGVMATVVHRDLGDADPLAALLSRRAFTLSGDAVQRLRDGEYELRLNSGVSYVDGDAAAINRLQRSSARYFQRPDATYIVYDPLRTSLAGARSGASIERRNGRHWLWDANVQVESPEFETNDLGRLNSSDGIGTGAQLQYRETVPGRWFRDYSISFGSGSEWNFGRDLQSRSLQGEVDVTWPNFWETQFNGSVNLRSQDMRLTRGGPSMERPQSWNTNLELESSESATTRGEFSIGLGGNEDRGSEFEVGTEITFQPGSRWQLSINPQFEREINTQQFVSSRSGGPAATFGQRYIFARVDQSTYSTEIRLSYTFRPDLNLDFYGEPFASSGRFSGLGELTAARSRLMRVYGTDGTTLAQAPDGSYVVTDGASNFTLSNRDFNVQSFRSNLVLRWEWRPGSTMYLVWQQDRSADLLAGSRATIGNMFGSFGAAGDHFFAVKMSFWLSPS